jgi:hypothetical protein
MTSARATKNITGLSWCIDTHIVDNPDFEFLNRLFNLGWIYLQTPSTVLLELLNTKDVIKKERLLNMQSTFPTPMSPIVLGHSLLGYSVFASSSDEDAIGKIHEIIWNGKLIGEDAVKAEEGNKKARSRLRDTLIVQTSIRIGDSGLITQDEDLLKASSAISDKFMKFRIMSISQARNAALGGVAKIRRIQSLTPDNYRVRDLPDWPE